LLLLVEALLRVAGFGYPTGFFRPFKVHGRDCLVENDSFSWRFFGRDKAREPLPFVMPEVKGPGVTRIFVFGESAAYGDPQPAYSLSRILQTLLTERYPTNHFEVINTAMTAINSHVILPIARDCARQHGDIWVIYMGNNEVVGPFGSGTVFGPKAPNLALVRTSLAFKATRLGQALDDLAAHFQRRPDSDREWGGMEMFVNNQVRQDDPRMTAVYENFTRNLADIVQTGLNSGAKIVVSTMARNLKDCAPFGSLHKAGLSTEQLAQWENLYRSGIAAQIPAEALRFFQDAEKIDDTFAELHFRESECCQTLGQYAGALRHFTLACDQDVLRFRADSRIENIIRQQARGPVKLADAQGAMVAESPHGLVGDEFLYEHVHPNFAGNYVIARAIADQVADWIPGQSNIGSWPSAEACAKRLAWTDLSRREGDIDILSRLNDPPFTQQLNHDAEVRRLRQEVEQLLPASQPAGLSTERQIAEEAIATTPDDWLLRENLAEIQQKLGDWNGAAQSWQAAADLLPQSANSWTSLGAVLAQLHRGDEAVTAVQHALELDPSSAFTFNSLGQIYAGEGKNEEAVRQYEKSLALKPYFGPAHLGLGKALQALGRTNEAQAQFRQSLQTRINTPESFSAIGQFCFEQGWYPEAATNFMDSLRLNPANAEAQVNLGLTLDKLNHPTEAQSHYREAVRLDPNFAEAHFCLGLSFGREGDNAGAGEQFQETVRLKPWLLQGRLNLGIALFKQHRGEEARAQFEEVLRQDSGNRLALAYLQALQKAAASP
jgi:tetratricopeptide (TPR) repeat protein